MKVLFLILLFIGTAACGKKAPPMALESTVPMAVSDLKAWARESRIFLTWSSPARNTDGSRLEDLLGFRVFRRARPLSTAPCPDCPANFVPVGEIDLDYPRGAQVEEGRVLWRDPTAQPGFEYAYLVRAYNSLKTASPESNLVRVPWEEPPPPPERLEVRSADRALELSWPPSPEKRGPVRYNIYRRGKGERFPFFPLNAEPVSETRLLDAGLENGRTYVYQVRAVRDFRGTLIEGPSSPEVSGVPEKLLPPSPPTGLVAVRKKEGIELRWNRNPEPDVAGYNLYRKEEGERDFRRLNSRPIAENYFLDGQADPGKRAVYRVRALDTSPAARESEPSAEVEVAPTPSSSSGRTG
ncbi:MAG: hypothetical protein HY697_00785 [Deltaproteobacteria bacterium]|nr:hypothetical protein [Deltaproteobacteria bacterium]